MPFCERIGRVRLRRREGQGRPSPLPQLREGTSSPTATAAPGRTSPIVADQGILASTDPVAIDQAAYDLVKAAPVAAGSLLEGKAGPGDDKFALMHPETRPLAQLEHGERIGLGTRDYELVRV